MLFIALQPYTISERHRQIPPHRFRQPTVPPCPICQSARTPPHHVPATTLAWGLPTVSGPLDEKSPSRWLIRAGVTSPHGLASGVSPSDEIFSPWTVRTSGSSVVGEWSLGAADPGVDPCRNARAEIGAALPIDACGSTPAAGPGGYLKAASFWYSPSIPTASWALPGGWTWCVWYRRQADCQILGPCDDGARPASEGSNP